MDAVLPRKPEVPDRAVKPNAPPAEREPFETDVARTETLDRLVHAWQTRFTQALSPAVLGMAFFDWALHLANAPGKQQALVEKAVRKWVRLLLYMHRHAQDPACPPCIEPLPHDRRFTHPAWQSPPFDMIYQSFLLQQQWWHNATTGIRGVSRANERIAAFTTRQLLDVSSPANLPWTNPVVLRATLEQGGQNFLRGWVNLVQDWERAVAGRPPVGAENFVVGRDVAATPGKVVYRNELIELLQYEPPTGTVRPEPVLIVPAWIMKYYILDLSPENSLVRHLLAKGFTVFMVSWRNPRADQRDLGMEDYRRLGIAEALKAVDAIRPRAKVHACGYCLGGTLLSIAAAQMARDGDDRLASVTLFAAETDFSEAGELMLLITESQVAYLEDMMWEQGYLDSRQMAGTFQLLRSNDLVWSQMVRQYMLGERHAMTDLMAWNVDATRMPYRMHSEYLRHLFLDNDLAEGRYVADGRPVALPDIHTPMFVVGTETDHIAPWRSVYKIHLVTDADITFVLTTGGHNVGILGLGERRQGLPSRSFRIAERPARGRHLDPETWVAMAEQRDGSWWPAWTDWLEQRSGKPTAPPAMGAPEKGYPPLADAPGGYVLER
jgi:polyhydroxyalkanoate synthase subunit PhaC